MTAIILDILSFNYFRVEFKSSWIKHVSFDNFCYKILKRLFFIKLVINVGFYWDIFTNIYAIRLVKFFVIIYYICCNIKIIVMIILSKCFVIKNGLKSLYFSLWGLNIWKQKWKKRLLQNWFSQDIFSRIWTNYCCEVL